MDTEPREETLQDDAAEEKKIKKWDLVNKQWAATIIFSGVVLLFIAFLFIRHQLFTDVLAYVLDVLRPITIGLFIAFVLYRPTQQIDNLLKRAKKKIPKLPTTGLAVLITYLLLLLFISVIVRIIVPQFVQSTIDFTDNIMNYYNNVMQFLNSERGERILSFLNENGFDPASLRDKLTNLTDYIPIAIGTVSTWASSLIGGVIDVLIGLIFSIYVLAGQNKLKHQGNRILRHFLPQKHYNRLAHYGTLTFKTFADFISGKIVDSFIIGLIVFIIMSIGRLEYPMMIAVVIGITNIIPFVGPFIGTIPCALILLIANPIHAIAFVIIVIIVQQFDCNILTPYIVGNSVGLPAIWVLFAITVGGGLFGLPGMLMGVPVMSVIYTVIREKTGGDIHDTPQNKPKHRWRIKRTAQKVQNIIRKNIPRK